MLLALIFTACLAIGILLRLILVEYKNDDCTFFAQVSFMLVGVQTEFQTESYLFEECEKDDEGNDRFWIATDKAGNLNRVRNISTRVIPKAAFIQKPLDEGITIEEITELVGRLECEQVIPIEVQANSSCAIGFISLDAAEELDYDYDNLIRNVSEVIEDMDNETEYGNYDFDGFPVYIGY